MGMFDDIIVPKSYLRGLLDKKQEKLLKGKHSFQTKSLDNALFQYKVFLALMDYRSIYLCIFTQLNIHRLEMRFLQSFAWLIGAFVSYVVYYLLASD